MKVDAQSFSLTSVLVLTLALMGAVAAQGASPTGSFGFVLNVSYTNPPNNGGTAILGVMNFNGKGKVSGPYTLEFGSGGTVQEATITGNFTGTYSSNPDGTGSITITLDYQLTTLTLAMVIDDGGRGLQLVTTSCSGACNLSGAVFSGVGRAKRNTLGSNAGLIGSYGCQFTKSSPTPGTSLEVATFDGAGNVTVSGTFVGPGGQVVTGVFTGTYSVNADWTGNFKLSPQPGQGAQTFVFVITDGHSGLLLLQTNRSGDGVFYGTGRLR